MKDGELARRQFTRPPLADSTGDSATFFLVACGAMPLSSMLGRYLLPVLIGNTIGGVALVAFFNHAQVITETRPRKIGARTVADQRIIRS